MIFVYVLIALLGLYAVFILGPCIVSVCAIFAGGMRFGSDFDRATAPGAQFETYANALRSVRDAMLALPHADVTITASDGIPLYGTYWDRSANRTVILVHGYRSDPWINFALQADAFCRHGYNVLMIVQRGNREGAKERTTLGLSESGDVLLWNRWALERDGVDKTLLYGVSMGAASIAYASDRLDPDSTEALVLDCGFLSPYEQIRNDSKKRRLPTPLLMPVIALLAKLFYGLSIKKPTTDALRRTQIPCFFLHGTADETVPFAQGKAAYEACAARKEFFPVEGAGHAETYLFDPERAENALFKFINDSE